MYSRKDRIKAVKLYIQYDLSAAEVMRELGYPKSRKSLTQWYRDYSEELDTGEVKPLEERLRRYSKEQRRAAVDYYLIHGCSLTRTVRRLGYPSKQALARWLDELAPEGRKRNRRILCSYEQKKAAVVDLCTRSGTVEEVAMKHSIDQGNLYRWKKELLGKVQEIPMSNKPDPVSADPKELLKAIEALELEKKRLELEVDILTETAKLLKKDPSVDPENLSNLEKAMLIDALREKHRLRDLLKATDLPRSSYYYQRAVLRSPGKYEVLSDRIHDIFESNYCCYGYRRIHAELKKEGIIVSEKVVRRIMATNQLLVRRKKARYKSYIGEVSPAPDNLVARDFHADAPNEIWVTDISEFGIPAGKVYLSPIIDCMDGFAVSWSIGLRPTAELANTSLKAAVRSLKEEERPIVHSDRGGHYRWPGWLSIVEEHGLIRSMSAKGCPPDNAACEGFFGRIKNEFFYGRDWMGVPLKTFMEELDRYLRWYNQERIKQSLGWMSPVQYRQSLGLVA